MVIIINIIFPYLINLQKEIILQVPLHNSQNNPGMATFFETIPRGLPLNNRQLVSQLVSRRAVLATWLATCQVAGWQRVCPQLIDRLGAARQSSRYVFKPSGRKAGREAGNQSVTLPAMRTLSDLTVGPYVQVGAVYLRGERSGGMAIQSAHKYPFHSRTFHTFLKSSASRTNCICFCLVQFGTHFKSFYRCKVSRTQ